MICIILCACIIAVLYEQWMCLGLQRNIHITGNNLIPISVPIFGWQLHVYIGVFSSGMQLIARLWRGLEGMDIGISELVSCAFSTISICPFFNSKNFHLLYMWLSGGMYYTCNTVHLFVHMYVCHYTCTFYYTTFSFMKSFKKLRKLVDYQGRCKKLREKLEKTTQAHMHKTGCAKSASFCRIEFDAL